MALDAARVYFVSCSQDQLLVYLRTSKELLITKGQHDRRLFSNFPFHLLVLEKLYPSESHLFVHMAIANGIKGVTVQQDGDLYHQRSYL
jgi:hypothetical protein